MENNLNREMDKFYEQYQGASDLRTPEQKARDYLQTEFVTEANVVVWTEKKDNDWRTFPVLNQFFTSKCVAFTTSKLAIINYWLKTKEFLLFSPNSIYDYRSNKPAGGMIGDDAFKTWEDKGISLEAVCKSDQIQEEDPITISTFAKEVAKGFRLGNHITIPERDFDRVASTIQTTGKGVMVWFYFKSPEWSKKYPEVIYNLTDPYVGDPSRHSVCAVDFGLINGKEYLLIEDSAHFGGINRRWISREFFVARNFLTKYPMNFNYEDTVVVPPTFKFTLDLKLGSKNNEVLELQKYLQKSGLFPNNIVPSGYFGNVTKTAVITFQKARGLTPDGVVGAKTRAVLNS